MKRANKRRSSRARFLTTGIVICFFIGLIGYVAYLVSTDKGVGAKKVFIAKVDLVRPDTPPKEPPPPKEKPLEQQETKKIEPIAAPQAINQAPGPKADGKAPADGPLGLEGEGGAGSDGFGLAGRGKGGRDVTTIGSGGGGGYDMNSILRKNAWYNHRVQDEIDKGVRKYLNENGGIPKGKLEAVVKIGMDDVGLVAEHRIVRSSGNSTMDNAIKRYLTQARISEPPPRDIPKGEKGLAIMLVRISTPG